MIVLVVTCAEVSILLCYFQVHNSLRLWLLLLYHVLPASVSQPLDCGITRREHSLNYEARVTPSFAITRSNLSLFPA